MGLLERRAPDTPEHSSTHALSSPREPSVASPRGATYDEQARALSPANAPGHEEQTAALTPGAVQMREASQGARRGKRPKPADGIPCWGELTAEQQYAIEVTWTHTEESKISLPAWNWMVETFLVDGYAAHREAHPDQDEEASYLAVLTHQFTPVLEAFDTHFYPVQGDVQAYWKETLPSKDDVPAFHTSKRASERSHRVAKSAMGITFMSEMAAALSIVLTAGLGAQIFAGSAGMKLLAGLASKWTALSFTMAKLADHVAYQPLKVALRVASAITGVWGVKSAMVATGGIGPTGIASLRPLWEVKKFALVNTYNSLRIAGDLDPDSQTLKEAVQSAKDIKGYIDKMEKAFKATEALGGNRDGTSGEGPGGSGSGELFDRLHPRRVDSDDALAQ